MDDLEKKLFAQLDDPMPGQRTNALELLRDHLTKNGRTFRDIVQDIENAIPLHQYQDLENRCAAFAQANAGLAQQNNDLARRLAAYRGALAIKLHWKRALWIAALPVIGWLAYDHFTGESSAEREAARPGFERMASATTWVNSGVDTAPVEREVAGNPYWVTVRYREDRQHRDAAGRPVTVQCVRLYASPARPDAGAYLKPHPYSFFGWGWLTWPERAADCRTDTMRSAKK